MSLKITAKSLNGTVKAPPSKSVLHRELIVAFLTEFLNILPRENIIEAIVTPTDSDNDDVLATRRCLKALYNAYKGTTGVNIKSDIGADTETDIVMECGESGSTLRFLMTVASVFASKKLDGNHRLIFKVCGRLIERPVDQLAACLKEHGVTCEVLREENSVVLTGKLTEGDFRIRGDISSQYLSGILMALSLCDNSAVILEGELKSSGYVDLTLEVLNKNGFDVKISDGEGSSRRYVLEKNSAFFASDSKSEVEFGKEGDWSGGAFLLSMAALNSKGEIIVNGLNEKSLQKDKAVIDVLRKLNVKFDTEYIDGNASFKFTNGGNCDGNCGSSCGGVDFFEYDCENIPDIVPYIAVLCAFKSEVSKIVNIARLRHKESDRIAAVKDILDACGAENIYDEQKDVLTIKKAIKLPSELNINTEHDHRILQAGVLACVASGKTTYIDDELCINKSFPGMFEMLKKLGAEVTK